MPESIILQDIAELHQAMYDRLATITGIPGLRFLGFDSRRTNNPLPQIGLDISLNDFVVDEKRPPPMSGNRVITPEGDEQTGEYEGDTLNWYESSLATHPLPVSLVYRFESWCHDAQTQLQLDLAILQTFPYRGVLDLDIGGTVYSFPTMLASIANLDDLQENLRNRVYLYTVECWVSSHIADQEIQNILRTTTEFYESRETEDLGNETESELTYSSVLEQD